MAKVIWNKATGEALEVDSVDAREILANSDEYTDENPNPPKDPDGDGLEGAPQSVYNVENEFRREPVGDDVPEQERTEAIIRNPVTDKPRMAEPAPEAAPAPAAAPAPLKVEIVDPAKEAPKPKGK